MDTAASLNGPNVAEKSPIASAGWTASPKQWPIISRVFPPANSGSGVPHPSGMIADAARTHPTITEEESKGSGIPHLNGLVSDPVQEPATTPKEEPKIRPRKRHSICVDGSQVDSSEQPRPSKTRGSVLPILRVSPKKPVVDVVFSDVFYFDPQEPTSEFCPAYYWPSGSPATSTKANKLAVHTGPMLLDSKGEGYDKGDPFVDDTEWKDAWIPEGWTTRLGGHYIGEGKLFIRPMLEQEKETGKYHAFTEKECKIMARKFREAEYLAHQKSKEQNPDNLSENLTTLIGNAEELKPKKSKRWRSSAPVLLAEKTQFSNKDEDSQSLLL